MQITDVRVRKVAKEGKLKAVVSITMDEEFVVHDIKVIEGEKGLLLLCQVKRQWMENTEILLIQSIPKLAKRFKASSSRITKKVLEEAPEEAVI